MMCALETSKTPTKPPHSKRCYCFWCVEINLKSRMCIEAPLELKAKPAKYG